MDLIKRHLPLLFCCIAGIFLGSFLKSLFVHGEFKVLTFTYCVLFFALTYRYSSLFKKKNALARLITTNGESLTIQSQQFASATSAKNIDINQISTITIGDNYLSVIIGNNGNGYDFYFSASKSEIAEHIKGLMSGNSKVNYQYV
ncbi:hypothetical protein LP316_14235 [Thalassotalea sp. LPB0316]|uniref:hypothetical protein n=1 Tax=Thalassotalea sp. LPB0316 TaxID=2769490 RepID=UPI0018671EDF|nr:hypothetical protein [Thalassotalea sp. LPB0316]QOL25438.1 hypothetical protein LP316_14235 [Thalassotalea sp. LPB0316]